MRFKGFQVSSVSNKYLIYSRLQSTSSAFSLTWCWSVCTAFMPLLGGAAVLRAGPWIPSLTSVSLSMATLLALSRQVQDLVRLVAWAVPMEPVVPRLSWPHSHWGWLCTFLRDIHVLHPSQLSLYMCGRITLSLGIADLSNSFSMLSLL